MTSGGTEVTWFLYIRLILEEKYGGDPLVERNMLFSIGF